MTSPPDDDYRGVPAVVILGLLAACVLGMATTFVVVLLHAFGVL